MEAFRTMLTLDELKNALKSSIIGQDRLIDAVAVCLYKHAIYCGMEGLGIDLNNSSNLLIHGGTGTGKTFTVQQACKLLDVPLVVINAKSISQEGWQGTSFVKLLSERLTNIPQDRMSTAVVFIDEIDKLIKTPSAANVDELSEALQSGLLKYLEGLEIKVGDLIIPTRSMCFILAGAFTDLKPKAEKNVIGYLDTVKPREPSKRELFLKYGVMPELLGRIQQIVESNELTLEDFQTTAYNTNFVGNKWLQVLASEFDIHDQISIPYIISEAFNHKLGMRGLIQEYMRAIDDIIIRNSDRLNINLIIEKLTKAQIDRSLELFSALNEQLKRTSS